VDQSSLSQLYEMHFRSCAKVINPCAQSGNGGIPDETDATKKTLEPRPKVTSAWIEASANS
jgi:hypothetical protein